MVDVQLLHAMTVLDPVGEVRQMVGGIANFPSDIRGKTIGILDNFGAGTGVDKSSPDRIYRHFWDLLREELGEVEVAWARKPNSCAPAPHAMIDEMAQKADLVITGLAA